MISVVPSLSLISKLAMGATLRRPPCEEEGPRIGDLLGKAGGATVPIHLRCDGGGQRALQWPSPCWRPSRPCIPRQQPPRRRAPGRPSVTLASCGRPYGLRRKTSPPP